MSIEGGERLLHGIDQNHMQHTKDADGFGKTDVEGIIGSRYCTN